MLDKRVPYYNVIMCRKEKTPIPKISLPNGFYFEGFSKGDELAWAKIEYSVGEFNSINEALEYFKINYLCFEEEIKRRLIFVGNDQGEKVATFTIWWNYKEGVKIPSVHWVAVKPEFQGLGIGKAVVYKGMENTLMIEGDKDVYIHTQTWSYQAIGIYLTAGFKIMKTATFDKYKNDYLEAILILKKKLKGKYLCYIN